MGWLRNKRRNKLKEQLIKEGKLEQFRTKFKHQIKNIDDHIRVFDNHVKEAHSKRNDHEARLAIYQINEAQKLRNSILTLLATLEKAALQKDSQEIYEEFLFQLGQFKDAFKEDKTKKRKVRRVVKRYKKEVTQLDSQLDWIDRKVERIDKSLDRKENISEKSLATIDVESYLKSNE